MKLFINEIIVDERIRKNPTHIKELIDDIKENGQIQPITVRIDDNGSYRLVAGFRRLTAMKALGELQNRAEKGAHHYSVPGRSCEPLGHQTN